MKKAPWESTQGAYTPSSVDHYKKRNFRFHEFQFFDNANIMEYEANVFAAEFLLSDEDVLDALENQLDFFGTASLLNVPPELLSFKIRILQRQGYEIESPIIAKSDFLRRDISKPMS